MPRTTTTKGTKKAAKDCCRCQEPKNKANTKNRNTQKTVKDCE